MTLHEMFSLRRADGRARLCILASECLKAIYTALTTGVFLTGFLLASGADNVSISVITSVPLISGILYPLGPLLLERFRRRKVLLGAFRLAFHGFTILGVTLLPLLVRGPAMNALLIGSILLGSVANTLVASGFPAWHITFLPEEIRGRFFAVSGVVNSVFTALASLAAGVLSDFATSSGNQFFWLSMIRTGAFVLALAELVILLLPAEREYPAPAETGWHLVTRPLADKNFLRVMVTVFFWMFLSTMTLYAANAYLLDEVRVPYTFISVLQACNIPVTVAVMPLWHRLLRKTSWFFTFGMAFFLFALYPLLHMTVTGQSYRWSLPATMLVYQAVMAGGTFCFSNMAYIFTPENDRTAYLSVHLMLVALGSLGGQGLSAVFLKVQRSALAAGGVKLVPTQQLLAMQAVLTLAFAVWFFVALRPRLEAVQVQQQQSLDGENQ